MDHHELLTTVRTVGMAYSQVQQKRTADSTWNLVGTPLMFPECPCPFCGVVARSPYVWLLEIIEPRKPRLLGAFLPSSRGFTIVYPSHPHNVGNGVLCLGKHLDVWSLFASPPYLDDCPMGRYYVPRWYYNYWNHSCEEALDYLVSNEFTGDLIREYKQILGVIE